MIYSTPHCHHGKPGGFVTTSMLQRLRQPRRQRVCAILAGLALVLQALLAQAMPLKADAPVEYILLCTERGLVAVPLGSGDDGLPLPELPTRAGPYCPVCLIPVAQPALPPPVIQWVWLDLTHAPPSAVPASAHPEPLLALPLVRDPPA